MKDFVKLKTHPCPQCNAEGWWDGPGTVCGLCLGTGDLVETIRAFKTIVYDNVGESDVMRNYASGSTEWAVYHNAVDEIEYAAAHPTGPDHEEG